MSDSDGEDGASYGDDVAWRGGVPEAAPPADLHAEPDSAAGYLVRLTDAETAELHRLLDAVEARADQPRGGIRWVETIRGKLARRRP